MEFVQLSIIRIDGYGPWTLTLGSDREARLQMLQARIYHDVQKHFAEKDCIVFFNRFDELFAVTNGLSALDHGLVLDAIKNDYKDLKLSVAIGRGPTAFEANRNAALARKNSLQPPESASSPSLKDIFQKSENGERIRNKDTKSMVQIFHIDVDGSTKVGLKYSPYEVTLLVTKLYSRISDEFLKKNALTFFLGGDNFMVISNGVTRAQALGILQKVMRQGKVKLNCGIGRGRSGREAAKAATQALDRIRELRDRAPRQFIYEVRLD